MTCPYLESTKDIGHIYNSSDSQVKTPLAPITFQLIERQFILSSLLKKRIKYFIERK